MTFKQVFLLKFGYERIAFIKKTLIYDIFTKT